VTAIDLATAFSDLLTGLQSFGNAITMIVQWTFQLFGVALPDYIARAIVILVTVVMLLKVGSKVSEVVLLIFIVMIIATLLGVKLPWSIPSQFIQASLVGI
jgi:hypothetical protein